MEPVWSLLLTGAGGVCALMLALWLIHLPLRNASIVDFGWAAGTGLLGVWYAARGGGDVTRAWLLGTMAGLWGLRLGLYLLGTRVIGHPEEGRYQELRRKWGSGIEWKFLLFFQFQALLCVLLSAPFLAAARNAEPSLSWLEYGGAALWLVAFAGETAADWQLHRFKSDPANKGKTCRAGLWRYSRHPNYFFEWLIWVAFALFALGSPGGYWGLVAPLLMLYFLFRVTGIPATEEQAVRTRGEDYREYQRTTSSFVPWFPRGRA